VGAAEAAAEGVVQMPEATLPRKRSPKRRRRRRWTSGVEWICLEVTRGEEEGVTTKPTCSIPLVLLRSVASHFLGVFGKRLSRSRIRNTRLESRISQSICVLLPLLSPPSCVSFERLL
jgi:hypothetical protein